MFSAVTRMFDEIKLKILALLGFVWIRSRRVHMNTPEGSAQALSGRGTAT